MKKNTFSLFIFFISNALFAQPANDIPCGATELTVNLDGNCINTVYTFDDTETDSSGFANPSCLFNRTAIEDRWYWFQMPADGKAVRIITSYENTTPVNSFDDPAIEIFAVTNDSDPCNNLESIDCDDDGNPDTTASQLFTQIEVIEPANSFVYFRIWHNNGDNIGDFNMCLQAIDAPLVATNDECDSPIDLPLGITCSPMLATNFQATPSAQVNPECADNDGDDVWFTISVPDDKFYDIAIETSEDPGSSVFDTAIAVYSGSCGALIEVACDDDAGTGLFSLIDNDDDLKGLKDITLFVRVFPVQIGQTGTFNICAAATETLNTSAKEDIQDFVLFPNPASNEVNLKFKTLSSNSIGVGIYDLQGKLVLHTTKKLFNNFLSINIDSLKTGMYFLQVNDGENETTKKLFIK